jgi:hypothetical protein
MQNVSKQEGRGNDFAAHG